ncbi:hypothetical protein SRB17_89560 [Streptomyces sp. RB17]|nr:hypothetical protein [Streptomyces sp. RB17]MQY40923.1 hypothetical protein [Streptomyces sp. RB17]
MCRAALTSLAASFGLPYARALLPASLDYAHRTGGCAQQRAVLHELVAAHPPADEPGELSALLQRLRLVHQAGTQCQVCDPDRRGGAVIRRPGPPGARRPLAYALRGRPHQPGLDEQIVQVVVDDYIRPVGRGG